MLKKQRLTATLSCPVWNQRTVQRSRCPIGPNKLHHVTSKTNPVLLISCRMVCWIYRNAMWPLTSEQWRHVISLRLKATHCGPKLPEKTQTRDKGTVRRSDRETKWPWDDVTLRQSDVWASFRCSYTFCSGHRRSLVNLLSRWRKTRIRWRPVGRRDESEWQFVPSLHTITIKEANGTTLR